MASLACAAELPVVGVVAAVAADARAGNGQRIGSLLAVARAAQQTLVCAVQRELRLCRVVEAPQSPATWVVALAAIGAEAAAVFVVLCVTVRTRLPGVVECRTQVTLIAGCQSVHAQQRKVCELVIEADVPGPG